MKYMLVKYQLIKKQITIQRMQPVFCYNRYFIKKHNTNVYTNVQWLVSLKTIKFYKLLFCRINFVFKKIDLK